MNNSPWARVQEFLRVVAPLWLTALIVGVLMVAMFVPQIREVLTAAISDGHSGFSQKMFLGLSVVATTLSAWYFSRGLLYARYWNTPEADTPGERERYYQYKIWTPRVLGLLVLAPIVVVYFFEGYWLASGVFLAIAIAFGLFVLVRSRIF